jgi:transcription elongation factor Elf1
MSKVKLQAYEYTWVCPKCGHRNWEDGELEEKMIECDKCHEVFEAER